MIKIIKSNLTDRNWKNKKVIFKNAVLVIISWFLFSIIGIFISSLIEWRLAYEFLVGRSFLQFIQEYQYGLIIPIIYSSLFFTIFASLFFYLGKEYLFFKIVGILFVASLIGIVGLGQYSRKTTNPGICEMIRRATVDSLAREECFFILAARTNNPNFCVEAMPNYIEDCLRQFSIQQLNPDSCVRQKNEYYKELCYQEMVKRIGGINEICKKLFPEISNEIDCIANWATQTNNPDLCDLFQWGRDNISCRKKIATMTNNPDECLRLLGGRCAQISCIVTFAIETNNIDLCKKFEKYERDICYWMDAYLSNNFNLCAKIKDSVVQELCYAHKEKFEIGKISKEGWSCEF